ncbi:MAG: hypothetical protein ACSHW1_01915 [Yoonia sp.]
MTRLKAPFVRLTIVFALLVALATSGFAHRAAPVVFDEALASYLAAGGTISDLCADAGDEKHSAGQICDACHLVDAMAVPPEAFACQTLLPRTAQIRRGAQGDLATFAAFDPVRPVRAPPLV